MQTTTLFTNDAVADQERALARDLANHLLPNHPEGGTYDPRMRSLPTFTDDRTYLVSLPGYEYRVWGKPSIRRLIAWLKRVRRVLALKEQYLGWWRDGQEWVFDISIALNGGRSFILGLAHSWGQEAVFHPASKLVLYVAPQLEQAA